MDKPDRTTPANKIKLEPNEPMHYAGWISPDGKLYSCPSEAHARLAYILCEMLYKYNNSKGDPEKLLENKNWLKVDKCGYVYYDYVEEITLGQLAVLKRLLSCEHHSEPPQVIMDFPGDGKRWFHSTGKSWKYEMQSAIHFLKDRAI